MFKLVLNEVKDLFRYDSIIRSFEAQDERDAHFEL